MGIRQPGGDVRDASIRGWQPILRGHPPFASRPDAFMGAKDRQGGRYAPATGAPGVIVLARRLRSPLCLPARTCRRSKLRCSIANARPHRMGFADEKDLDAFFSKLGQCEGRRRSLPMPGSVPAGKRVLQPAAGRGSDDDPRGSPARAPHPPAVRALSDVAEASRSGAGTSPPGQNVQFHCVHWPTRRRACG